MSKYSFKWLVLSLCRKILWLKSYDSNASIQTNQQYKKLLKTLFFLKIVCVGLLIERGCFCPLIVSVSENISVH